MSGTLCFVLMLLWDLGRVSNWTLGGWLHLLPLLAVAIVLLTIREAVGQSPPLTEDTFPDRWPPQASPMSARCSVEPTPPPRAAWSARGGKQYSVGGTRNIYPSK